MNKYFSINDNIPMKKEKIIFLDLDGVIADWMGSACKIIDCDPSNKKIRNFLKDEGDQFYRLADKKLGKNGSRTFWNAVEKMGNEFWAELELLPWAKELYEELNKLGRVCFLTSPGGAMHHAAGGKVEFIARHFNNTSDFFIGKHKHLAAGKNKILVDDSSKKIKPFIKAGGTGFLWPNQYKLMDNDISLKDTYKKLFKMIKDM